MDAVLHRVSSPTFVGRADELAALDGALGRAAAGVPAFTFVAGESGVGKSRLVAELEARARNAGARVFVGHCLELGGAAIPYAPLVDALRPIARELAECGSDIADALPPASRAALAELMPEFRAPDAAADGDGAQQARVFEALLALIERLGRVQPVVLVLEDLHWADQSTRDFLTFLVRSARDGAALARRHLPLRRAAPPPPAAAAAGRARAHARRRPARARALQPRRAARADLLDPRRAGARRPRRPAVRAQRGQPALHRGAARRLLRRLPGAARDAARPARRARRAAAGDRAGGRARDLRRAPDAPRRCSPRCRDLDEAELLRGLREAVAHQVLVAGLRRDVRVPPRARRRGRLRRPAAGRAQRAARAARGDRRRAPRADGRRARRGRGRDARLPLERRARRPARARRSVAAGLASKRVLAFSEAQRHFERALELWDRVPDAEERAGCDRVDVLRHAAAAAANAGEAARSLALARKAIAEVDAAGRPAAGRVPATSGSATTSRWAGETEEGFAAYAHGHGAAARRREPAARPPARVPRARADAARALRGGRRGRPRRRSRWPSAATTSPIQTRALNTLGLSRAALGDDRGGASRCCAARATSPPPRGRQVEHVQAITNLSEVLDLAGRTAEALAEIEAGMEALRANPERDLLRHVHGAAGRQLHDQARPAAPSSRTGCRRRSSATPSAPPRSSSPSCARGWRCSPATLGRGAPPARRVPPPVPRHAATRSGWSRCTRCEAQLALLEDRHERRARRDPPRARRRSSGVAGGHADRAAGVDRADGRGDRGRAGAGARRAAHPRPTRSGCSPSSSAAAAMPGRWADAPAYEALARAEAGRLRHRARRRASPTRPPGSGAVERVRRARAALARRLRGLPRRRGARAGRRPRGRGRAAARGARARGGDGRRAAAGRDRRAGPARAAGDRRARAPPPSRAAERRGEPGRAARPHPARARGAAAGRRRAARTARSARSCS